MPIKYADITNEGEGSKVISKLIHLTSSLLL